MSKKRLRSERAQRRQQRRQMQQIAIGVIALVIVTLVVINLWPEAAGTGPLEYPQFGSDAVTTASGLTYQDEVVGDGAEAVVGSSVTVHYTGWLEDQTIFDSSVERGQPATFQLAPGALIDGWVEGIPGMRVGGTRILSIPSDLAYGPGGNPPTIPGGATLIFRVELLDVQ